MSASGSGSVRENELSPRALASWLAPELAFDRPALGDYVLYDAYRHETRDVVCVVLQNGEQAITVDVTPDTDAPAAARAAGLALSWRKPGPEEPGVAACKRLASRLGAVLGATRRAWQVPQHDDELVPEPLVNEIRVEPARLSDDPDGALLERDAGHYARLYAVRPRPVRVRSAERAAPGLSITYPPPRNGTEPPSGAIHSAPSRVVRRRIFRRYFAALGCVFDAGQARTVPTPATFDRARRELCPDGAPLRIELLRGRFRFVTAGPWIRGIARDHALPVRVAPRWAVELHRLFQTGLLFESPIDVGMLPHDMSLHAIGFHRIPREHFSELTALAARRLGRSEKKSDVGIARFFEETLTRAAWDVWKELERPSDFASRFDRDFDRLRQALERA
jgi:hypothetical protein